MKKKLFSMMTILMGHPQLWTKFALAQKMYSCLEKKKLVKPLCYTIFLSITLVISTLYIVFL